MKCYTVVSENHPTSFIHADTIQEAWIDYLEGYETAVVIAVFETSLKLNVE